MALVTLWENLNFGGRYSDFDVSAIVPWGDGTAAHPDAPLILYSSIQINTEQWVLFGDTTKPDVDDDNNVLLVYGPSQIPDLTAVIKYDSPAVFGQNGNWNDKITRVQFLDSATEKPDQLQYAHTPTILGDSATIYNDGNFGGETETLWPGLGNLSINDQASSVKVPTGYLLTLYWDANQSGAAYPFAAGDHPSVPAEFNDQASSYSLRRVGGSSFLPAGQHVGHQSRPHRQR